MNLGAFSRYSFLSERETNLSSRGMSLQQATAKSLVLLLKSEFSSKAEPPRISRRSFITERENQLAVNHGAFNRCSFPIVLRSQGMFHCSGRQQDLVQQHSRATERVLRFPEFTGHRLV